MTEVLEPPLTGPVGEGVDALAAALDGLVAATGADGSAGELWQLGSGELLELTAAVHTLVCRQEAVLHALVREVDARGAAVAAGATGTAAWLSSRCRLHPGAARRVVRTARGLHEEATGPLVRHDAEPGEPADPGAGHGGDDGRLRAAFAAGELGAEHAAVATQTLDAVRRVADAGVVEAAERFLVEQSRVFAGCDRPPEWCEAHHLQFWADGGITAVTNMCLLCSAHHDAVHHHGWQLELREGRIWTTPPPWIDPTRGPRRNTGRDLHTDVVDLLPDGMVSRQHGARDGERGVTDRDAGPDPPNDP